MAVALDQWYQRRQKDAEGDFYRKIASQGPRKPAQQGDRTTQGLYAAAPDGTFLGFTNNRSPDYVKRVLKKALQDYRPGETPALDPGKPDPRFLRRPPEGGLVVRVTAKVLGGYGPPKDPWEAMYQNALARDNFWIRKDEHDALARGELRESLSKRLAKYHLVDNTRGEPPMWEEQEIRRLELKLERGRLSGSVHLETPSGDRGYVADVLGFVEAKEGRVTRFDLVASGRYWGHGPFTGHGPAGKFPFAVACTRASGDEEADKVAPEGARGHQDYLR